MKTITQVWQEFAMRLSPPESLFPGKYLAENVTAAMWAALSPEFSRRGAALGQQYHPASLSPYTYFFNVCRLHIDSVAW